DIAVLWVEQAPNLAARGLHALGQAVAGYVLLLHRLPDLPRKDFLDGDGLEPVALAFFAKEIIERGEFGGRTDYFLLPRHIGLLHFSNSRRLRRARTRSSAEVFRVFLMNP